MNDGEHDEHSADEPARYKKSNALIAQEKAVKQAKKRARQEQEANRLIEAGSGARPAKQKGLEKKLWLEAEGKHQSPRKAKESNLKKSNTTASSAKEKKGKREMVPTSRRSLSPPTREEPKHRKVQPAPQKAKKNRVAQVKGKRKQSKHSESSTSASESAGSGSEESELTELTDAGSGNSDSNDSESEEFNEDLSESGLGNLMESEQAMVIEESSAKKPSKAAQDLFEIDEDDVLVVNHTRGSSSSQSHPPTSDSEDPPSSIRGSWAGNEEDNVCEVPAQRAQKKAPSKKSKASETREAKFREERATIVSAPAKPSKSNKRMKSVTEDQLSKPFNASHAESDADVDWPAHTKVNNGGLLQQNLYIRAVCHKAIKIVEKTLVFEEAWPELHRVSDYRVEVLVDAAKSLEKTGSQYHDIRKRVKKDTDFARTIGKWVVDRLSHTRSPVRINALGSIAMFELGVDESCIKRVAFLLTTDTYVYPGHWETDSRGNPKWVVRGNQIYLNKGIIGILRASFFSSSGAIGFRYKDSYTSSHPTRPERELPISLVALAATGIHAALDAWKDGDYLKKKSDKFDGETYKSIFNRHVKYLQGLKAKNINAFHFIMSDLHAKVVGNVGQDDGPAQTSGDALAVLDLSGFD